MVYCDFYWTECAQRPSGQGEVWSLSLVEIGPPGLIRPTSAPDSGQSCPRGRPFYLNYIIFPAPRLTNSLFLSFWFNCLFFFLSFSLAVRPAHSPPLAVRPAHFLYYWGWPAAPALAPAPVTDRLRGRPTTYLCLLLWSPCDITPPSGRDPLGSPLDSRVQKLHRPSD